MTKTSKRTPFRILAHKAQMDCAMAILISPDSDPETIAEAETFIATATEDPIAEVRKALAGYTGAHLAQMHKVLRKDFTGFVIDTTPDGRLTEPWRAHELQRTLDHAILLTPLAPETARAAAETRIRDHEQNANDTNPLVPVAD